MTNYIQFKKQRELGEIISDTFKFLRENYRLFLKLIFKITAPVFLILLISLSYYSYIGIGRTFNNPFLTFSLEGEDAGLFFIALFAMLLSLLAFYVLLHATVLHFIKSYINHQGAVIEKEVVQGVKNDFGGLLALLVLASIITFFGLLLCVLPGIFVWVPLSLTSAILVFRKEPVFDSITEAFGLIKDNWWVTFASLLVMVLLVYIIGLIFQIPMFIYFFIKTMTMVQEGSVADPASLFDWVYVVLNVISSLAQYLLSSIVIVATAFIYFNLNEKKNFTGTYETISNLGSQENN